MKMEKILVSCFPKRSSKASKNTPSKESEFSTPCQKTREDLSGESGSFTSKDTSKKVTPKCNRERPVLKQMESATQNRKRKWTQMTLGSKKLKVDDKKHISSVTSKLLSSSVGKRVLKEENLHCDYFPNFYKMTEADKLLQDCEDSLEYFTGELATIKLYGKSIPIPRKQVAHGDEGLTYTYSRMTVPAKPWLPLLEAVRDKIEDETGFKFNFVLINRYKDGLDSIGEHRDDEEDLDPRHPIASLSIGQHRDFILKHKDARGKMKTRDMEPIKLELQHGSLLMMNYPTNQYWYHSVPRRPNQHGVRINMTFRKILSHA